VLGSTWLGLGRLDRVTIPLHLRKMGWNDIVLTKLLLLQPGVCPNNKQWCEVDCGKIAASASAVVVVVVVVGVCTADADTCCTIRLFDNKNGSSDYDVALFVAVIKVSRGVGVYIKRAFYDNDTDTDTTSHILDQDTLRLRIRMILVGSTYHPY